jgi:TrmH family RNA methyltransferase
MCGASKHKSKPPCGFTATDGFATLACMKRMAEMRSGRAAPPRLSESIESRENRWLKRFRAALAGDALAERSEATQIEGEIAGVEGARLVETALRSGVDVFAVLFSETGAKHLPKFAAWIPPDTRLLRTTDRLFASVSGTETPQGVAALVRPRAATFDDLVTAVPLVLVLAGVQDPGNVGTLVRTAEALGATGVAACAAGGIGTANPYAPKAMRASAGSALRLPIFRGMSAPVLLAQLRVAGVRTYAACPEGIDENAVKPGAVSGKPLAPWEIDWRGAAALLIGNEGAGLPAELVRSADGIVRIPQPPHASPGGAAPGAETSSSENDQQAARSESLNAAIAGSILLYEAARQRGFS